MDEARPPRKNIYHFSRSKDSFFKFICPIILFFSYITYMFYIHVFDSGNLKLEEDIDFVEFINLVTWKFF